MSQNEAHPHTCYIAIEDGLPFRAQIKVCQNIEFTDGGGRIGLLSDMSNRVEYVVDGTTERVRGEWRITEWSAPEQTHPFVLLRLRDRID